MAYAKIPIATLRWPGYAPWQGNGQVLGKTRQHRGHLNVFRDRDDGAAAVEFAIVLPLLVMLVFGIISFGIIFHHRLSLGDGAREAARYGATLPVTNFASAGDPMQVWLDAIAARAIADATGSLDPGVPNRTICVSYVYPDGTSGVDSTRRRTEVGGSISYATTPCFNDGRPNDERRVQIQLGRDFDFVVILASKTISLSAESVSRFEASLVSS